MLSRRNSFMRPMFSNLLEDFLSQSSVGTSRYRNSRYVNMPSVFDVTHKVDDENNTVVTHMFVPGISAEQIDVSVDGSSIHVVINVDNENSDEFTKQIYSGHMQKSFRMTAD